MTRDEDRTTTRAHLDRRGFVRAGAGVVAAVGLAGCTAYFRDEVGQKTDAADLRQIAYGETKEGFVHEDDGTDPEYGDVAEPVTFDGSTGDAVTITMEAPNMSAYLVLEGPSGGVVDEHQRGEGPTSIIERTLQASGTYTIWVGSTSGQETGPYTLTLQRG